MNMSETTKSLITGWGRKYCAAWIMPEIQNAWPLGDENAAKYTWDDAALYHTLQQVYEHQSHILRTNNNVVYLWDGEELGYDNRIRLSAYTACHPPIPNLAEKIQGTDYYFQHARVNTTLMTDGHKAAYEKWLNTVRHYWPLVHCLEVDIPFVVSKTGSLRQITNLLPSLALAMQAHPLRQLGWYVDESSNPEEKFVEAASKKTVLTPTLRNEYDMRRRFVVLDNHVRMSILDEPPMRTVNEAQFNVYKEPTF